LGNKARAFEGFQLRLRMTKWEVALLLEGLKELKETKMKLSNEAERKTSQLKIEKMVQHDRLINEGHWDAAGKLKQIRAELKLARKQHFNMWEKDAINILINRFEALQQGKIRHSGNATTRLLSALKRASQPQPSQTSAPTAVGKEAA
jgi:hypothetical protein